MDIVIFALLKAMIKRGLEPYNWRLTDLNPRKHIRKKYFEVNAFLAQSRIG